MLPVAVLLGMVAVPAPTAEAAECLPAGGADGDPPISLVQTVEEDPTWDREVSEAQLDPFAPDAHDVVFSGGGWGHGIGLSQYAAQGAAKLGCTAAQIIETHFPDTTIDTRTSRDVLRLKLWTTGAEGVTSVWAEESFDWVVCDQNDAGVKSNCRKLDAQPAGTTVQVSLTSTGWRLQGGGVDESVDDRTHTLLEARHRGNQIRVKQGTDASSTSGLAIDHGHLELDYTSLSGGRLFATEVIDENSGSGMSAMETYLLGLAEVPFSWEPHALRAQVIAARSFAEATAGNRQSYTDEQRIQVLDCRCDLRVDTGDQVWAGATKRLAEPAYWPNWVDAVQATTDQYVVRNGGVLTTFYSSSHGGRSRAGFSYTDSNYARVDTSRWEKASGNSRYRWSQGFSVTELERAFGIDDIDAIRVVDTDDSGYPLSVEISGVDEGAPVTEEFDPYQHVRSWLGLFSPRFVIHEVTDLADDDQIDVARLAGDTRVDTAIRLARAAWSTGSETVVLARHDDPADALTGSALAGTHDAPLLLTPRDGLADAVKAELARLQPEQVLMLGGPVALDEQVAQDVRALGIPTVTRVHGDTRHATAVDVATRVSRGDQTTAYLVRLRDTEVEARGWADALSVSAVAARRSADDAGWPILGTEDTLPDATVQAIDDLGITRVVPVGGPVTIPDSVLEQLADLGVEVAERLAGGDRYGTSRAVTSSDTPTAESLVIATGENFPDGLAAGPYVARTGGALLLVRTDLDPEASPWLADQHPAFIDAYGWEDPRLVAVGGPVAITNPVISHTANLLEAARP